MVCLKKIKILQKYQPQMKNFFEIFFLFKIYFQLNMSSLGLCPTEFFFRILILELTILGEHIFYLGLYPILKKSSQKKSSIISYYWSSIAHK